MPARLVLQESQGTLQVLYQPEGQVLPEAAGLPEPFAFPLSTEELEDLRWYLEDYLRAPYAVYEDRGQAIAGCLKGWGERLFGALFGPGRPGQGAYREMLSAGSTELWISSESPAVLALPWELLHDPEHREPLSLQLAGITRTIPGEERTAALPPPGERLRVLMVIARPGGRADVRYRAIARPLFERLAPVAGEVEIEVLRPPTFDALERRLGQAAEAGEPFHILHFDGHGGFAKLPRDARRSPHLPEGRQGLLLFEREDGRREPISALTLAPVLSAARVPLLVFNACKSGKINGGEPPEAAVATSLLAGGAAAIVAMGYNVYAVAAAEFMAAFYEALFAGRSVSEAVSAGRRQLAKTDRRPSPKGPLPLEDWMVPVLYARSEVVFPELRQTAPRPSGMSLEEALAAMRPGRAEAAAGEGVHAEGSIEPVGVGFFGRDGELLELERTLRLRRVVVLHGTGGTGKTELAKAFARWLRDSGGLEDPDGVFFHSFEPGVATFGLDGVLASVGLRLFGADFSRLDREQRREAVRGALREIRLLLIWDNFESVFSMPDPAGVTKPLDEVGRREIVKFLEEIAREARGGIVITSRSPEGWLGAEIRRIEVGGLDAADVNDYAEALLASLHRARVRRKDPEYPKLLEFLDGHPLSLRLVLPQMEQVAPGELLAELRGEVGRDGRPADVPDKEGRLESLEACVHYSIRHLPEEYQERLPALTLFEGVADVDTLAVLSRMKDAPARFMGVEKGVWEAILDACVAAGLLTSLGGRMYRIHPALPGYLAALWRERAGRSFESEREAARIANVRAHAALGRWLKQQIEKGNPAIALAVLEVERRSLGTAAADALERGLFREAQYVLESLDELWNSRGLVEEARAWGDRCRTATEDEAGTPPDFEAPTWALWLFVVGSQANRNLDAGALDEAEAAYNTIRRVLEASTSSSAQPHLTASYHQLGRVAQERGDLSSAESWYRRSLEITAPGDRSGMASLCHQLGTVEQKRGNLAAAESWYRKSLEIDQALGSQSGLASSYHQLGRVAQERGDLSSAESWYRQSLEIWEALGDHSEMAMSYHQLGNLAYIRGARSSAESWYRRSLEIEEALRNQPGMAGSYHQLGIVSQACGDLTSAESWYRRSLEISEALGDRPRMASSYHQLGVVAQERGDLSSAEASYKRSLEILEDLEDKPGMANSYHQLGNVAYLLDDLSQAESWYRWSQEIREALGLRPGMALSYAENSRLAGARGDFASALDWTIRCVALFTEFPHPMTNPGPDHLVRLTAHLGVPALEASWQRVTGEPLPENVRAWVAARLTEGEADPSSEGTT